MKKYYLLLSVAMAAMFANAQSSVTLDGFAEIAGMKSCDNRIFEKNIYAIGALTWNINRGWSTTIEGEFDQKEFNLTQWASFSKLAPITLWYWG